MFYVLFVFSNGATLLSERYLLSEAQDLYKFGKLADGVNYVQMGVTMGDVLSAELCGELQEAVPTPTNWRNEPDMLEALESMGRE